MDVLYANGDSFVFGMECIKDFDRAEENKELAFPKHVAGGLECNTYINNAYNGATNEFIFRNTIFDLLELEKQGTKPDDVFVLIGWTSLHRFEINGEAWYNTIPEYRADPTGIENKDVNPEFVDFKSLFVNPSSNTSVVTPTVKYNTDHNVLPFCVDFVWHDCLQIPQQQARILALHGFLKSRGYRHLFVNAVDSFESGTVYGDTLNFYKLSNESFFKWALEMYPSEHRANNHFSPIPHAEYGKLLLDYIVKNKL